MLRNPLMLSMIASIAKLRAGVDMPETTAAIYATAADAMLRRAASPPSAAAVALLEATFFEAHAAEERIVTLAHVEAAAARRGADGAAAAAALQHFLLELCCGDGAEGSGRAQRVASGGRPLLSRASQGLCWPA